jgi:Domain of unknown function (DUF4209)
MSGISSGITKSDFDKYPWSTLIAPGAFRNFYEYSTRFFQERSVYEQKGDEFGTQVFGFLAQVASLAQDFDTREKPFACRINMGGRRSVDLYDFDEADGLLMAALVPYANDPQLRARLADVSSAIKFNHNITREAVKAYLEAARALADPEHWVQFIAYVERAAALAASLGRNQQPIKDVIAEVEGFINRFGTSDFGFSTSKLMDVLLEHRANPERFILTCLAIADRAEKSDRTNKWLVARDYWKLSAKLQSIGKDEEGAKNSRIRAAETHVGEADEWLAREKPIHSSAAHHLKCAIVALTEAGAPQDRIDDVHQRMIAEQKLGVSEMGTFSVPIDLRDSVEAARQAVSGNDLQTAILKMAFGFPLTDFEELKKSVRENAGKFPFLALSTVEMVDQDGRTTGRRGSLWDPQSPGYEQAVFQEAFHEASSRRWPMTVQGFINVCAEQIQLEHKPSFRELAYLIQDNPVVPPGHELSFLRGLRAGFSGDMMATCYFLIPQFEAIIRYALASRGIKTTKIDNSLVQDVRLLGALLQLPETTEIFGTDLVLTMKGLLTEEFGSNLRNRLTHGMLFDQQCSEPNVLYCWWLLLRICLTPTIQALSGKKTEHSGSQESAGEDPLVAV